MALKSCKEKKQDHCPTSRCTGSAAKGARLTVSFLFCCSDRAMAQSIQDLIIEGCSRANV